MRFYSSQSKGWAYLNPLLVINLLKSIVTLILFLPGLGLAQQSLEEFCDSFSSQEMQPIVQQAATALQLNIDAVNFIRNQNLPLCNGNQQCEDEVNQLADDEIERLETEWAEETLPDLFQQQLTIFLQCLIDNYGLFQGENCDEGGCEEDPIVLDLNGDGFQFTNVEISGV